MPLPASRLILPAVRADAAGDYPLDPDVSSLPPGGFLLFGGSAAAAHAWIRTQRMRDPELIFASDLERGAGQQFRGLTSLPPAAAIAHLDDPRIAWRAGNITGREAAALGIDVVLAPVADVDEQAGNPIVGTRAFGQTPERAVSPVKAWVEGCQAAGIVACPKHFPGHGRTRGDSHLELLSVDATREKMDGDLEPFRGAIEAGAGAVMMAHVVYSALDRNEPASRSATIIEGLLRDELGFAGAVVTDALDMGGAVQGAADDPAAMSFRAGCDLLLMPTDPLAAARAVAAEAHRDAEGERRLGQALARRSALLRRASQSAGSPAPDPEDEQWAAEIARRAVVRIRGSDAPRRFGELVVVDDDRGGPHPPPSRAPLAAALRRLEMLGGDGGEMLIAVFSEPRAWKGRAGLSEASRAACAQTAEGRRVSFLIFGHPRLADELPEAGDVWCAWGGEERMQGAAAERLAGL